MTNNEHFNHDEDAMEAMEAMGSFLAAMLGEETANAIMAEAEKEGGSFHVGPGFICGHSTLPHKNPTRPAQNPARPVQNPIRKDMNSFQKDACGCNHSNEERHNCKCDCHDDKNQNNMEKVKRPIATPCHTSFYGASNVYTDAKGDYTIKMMLPGFAKEEISVSYIGKEITVKAVHEQKVADMSNDNGVIFVKAKEEFSGAETITRKFVFENALFAQTSMSLEAGILTIHIPVKAEETPTTISFE